VLLLEQDRSRWDPLLIRRGLAALARCRALGGSRGPYALQAALAACHAEARSADATDWSRIAALYAELAEVAPSPVVELNRAVAVGVASGPRPARHRRHAARWATLAAITCCRRCARPARPPRPATARRAEFERCG
jgi:predicted RNA polymerase sigma factor